MKIGRIAFVALALIILGNYIAAIKIKTDTKAENKEVDPKYFKLAGSSMDELQNYLFQVSQGRINTKTFRRADGTLENEEQFLSSVSTDFITGKHKLPLAVPGQFRDGI